MAIGWPVVRPSRTPDSIATRSASARGVTRALWPGRRRSRSCWITASLSGRREGQPSTTTPIAGPCDSPQVVTRNACPSELPGTLGGSGGGRHSLDRGGKPRPAFESGGGL